MNPNTTVQQASQTTWEYLTSHPFFQFMIKLFIAIVVVGVLLIISKIISSTVKKKIINKITLEDDEYVTKLGNLIEDIIFMTLALFSLFLGFEIIGFDVGLLLWWLSIWIWFAFKELLGNMLAWIMILTTKIYKLGDIIEVHYWNEKYFGRIEEITIRYTVLRLFNLRRIVIPNLTFITNPIETFSNEDMIRLETFVSVHYNTDLDKAIKVIKEAVASVKWVVDKDKMKIIIDKFADSGIDIKIWFFIDPNQGVPAPEILWNVNKAINEAFNKHWIVIPYPHRVITFDKNDENLIKTALFVKNYKKD